MLRLGETSSFDLGAAAILADLLKVRVIQRMGHIRDTFQMNDLDAGRWALDLGAVHETADAELNGIALGAAWKNPRVLSCKMRCDESEHLRDRSREPMIQKVVNSPPWDRSWY